MFGAGFGAGAAYTEAQEYVSLQSDSSTPLSCFCCLDMTNILEGNPTNVSHYWLPVHAQLKELE
jgi:hypothetical protein